MLNLDQNILDILCCDAHEALTNSPALHEVGKALDWQRERVEAAYTALMTLELNKLNFSTGDRRLDYHELAFCFVAAFHPDADQDAFHHDAIAEGRRLYDELAQHYAEIALELDLAERDSWQ